MAYYDGELLKQNFAKSLNEFEEINVPLSEVAIKIGQTIKNTPTADVVEVVQCAKCRHWIKTGYDPLLEMGYGYCYNDDSPFHCEKRPCTSEKYFCGSGERRADNDL